MKDINKKMYSTYALNTHILVQLGQNIRKIREKKKISIEDLCYNLGTTKRILSTIENGNKRLSIMYCEKIAFSLEVPLWKLLKFED